MAQLIARLVWDQKVGGLSPPIPTNKIYASRLVARTPDFLSDSQSSILCRRTKYIKERMKIVRTNTIEIDIEAEKKQELIQLTIPQMKSWHYLNCVSYLRLANSKKLEYLFLSGLKIG